jgi:hypothetical protein
MNMRVFLIVFVVTIIALLAAIETGWIDLPAVQKPSGISGHRR